MARIVPFAATEPSRNAFAAWLRENPLTPESARPIEEIDRIIAENRIAGG